MRAGALRVVDEDPVGGRGVAVALRVLDVEAVEELRGGGDDAGGDDVVARRAGRWLPLPWISGIVASVGSGSGSGS